jgi:amino acid adenylation domain-containing protein
MHTATQFSCFVIGEGTLPIQCAEILLNRGHRLCGIISSDGSVKHWAKKSTTPYIDSTDDLMACLSRQPFDYLFSIVNNQVLPKRILELPCKSAINYHDALLPRYAGSHATTWAIMQREASHGVTWHVMSELVDAGDILKQCPVDISDGETALTLNAKCYEAAVRSFAELIDDLSLGWVSVRKQELDARTFFSRYKRPTVGCVLSWNRCARDIAAFVRALDFGPYPNPIGFPKLALEKDFLIVREIDVLDSMSRTPPGTLTAIDQGSLQVSTADHEIVLSNLLNIDGRPLSIPDVVARFGLHKGYRFKDIDPELATGITELDSSVCRYEAFWIKRLAALQPLSLPYPLRDALHWQPARYASLSWPIPEELTAFLASHHPAWKLGDFLLAAFVAYLARSWGNFRFDIGFREVGSQFSLAGLEGFFASHVPLHVEISYAHDFAEVFYAVQNQVELARRYKTYARDVIGRYPVLRSAAELQGTHRLPLIVERREKLNDYEAVPGSQLTLLIPKDRTECRWFYDTSILDEESVRRMLRQLNKFMHDVIQDPDRRIADLLPLTEDECHQLLVEFNNTDVDYTKVRCLHQLFESQVERTPDAVAVECKEERLTYRELNWRANQVAHHLRARGVGPEVLVALCVERSLEMVVGLLGILKAGGAYVPLDPDYPKERLALMLEDTRAPVLVTQGKFFGAFPETIVDEKSSLAIQSRQSKTANPVVVCLDSDWKTIAQESEENLDSGVTGKDLAYVIYTSGSTGTPKGVEIEHAGLNNLAAWHQSVYGITAADRATQLASAAFDASAWELWPYLTVGASIHIPNKEILLYPSKLLDWLATEAITICFLPTPLAESVLEEPMPPSLVLRTLLTGGDRLRRIPKRVLPFRLANNYGPTENTVVTTWSTVATPMTNDTPPSIGKPIANTKIYILDANLHPVPVGVPGELYIGGIGLARGYLRRPDLTAEKFIPHPFSHEPGARLYKTGDLARYLPDGNIEFLGRTDDQVKIRGFRIELGEIEAILGQHPAVMETVVMAREESPGDKRLVAYVVPRQEGASTISELRSFAKEKLPEYMVPSTFVFLDRLPLTPNGKVDRKALPTPDQKRPKLEEVYVAPRNPVEEIIAEIWAEVLKVGKVGIHDNFFDLGGHSLLATQVMSRVREAFQLDLPLSRLFENPTVAGLAVQLVPVQSKDGIPEDIAEVLANVGSLSDEEAQSLLAGEIRDEPA